jgi:SAM-dependent methyltransferase
LADDPIGTYERDFRQLADGWESVAFLSAHAEALPYIPTRPGLVLDVGAGSGRDAAWFAAAGWEVVAIEPAGALREHAAQLHPSPRIRWENDRLPGLERTARLGLTFDLLWLSAVWMHLPPGDRARAFRKLVAVLKPGGRLIASLREGPAPPGRPMHPVRAEELERLAVEHGLAVRAIHRSDDRMGRGDVRWTVVALELPDDGTGALPLIRGIVLEDQKAATYKLALLRVVARIADQSAALARHADDRVELPLGLVALYWLRMYLPLVREDIPQAPGNRDGRGLGFVKEAFQAISALSPFELRPGASFGPPLGHWLARALGDAAATIARMPAHHLTFRDGRPILPTRYDGRPGVGAEDRLVVDQPFLWSYGTTSVPLHLWLALRRLASWIEPMLLAEWARLIGGYAAGQGRQVPLDGITRALRWIDPERDTAAARRIVARLLAAGQPIHCVWTGERLRDPARVEIDHCFPFSAWPCDDLWNLMPASRRANQQKRDRLVTAELLDRSRVAIATWWESAYRHPSEPLRARQFVEEVRASLPIDLGSPAPDTGFGLA